MPAHNHVHLCSTTSALQWAGIYRQATPVKFHGLARHRHSAPWYAQAKRREAPWQRHSKGGSLYREKKMGMQENGKSLVIEMIVKVRNEKKVDKSTSYTNQNEEELNKRLKLEKQHSEGNAPTKCATRHICAHIHTQTCTQAPSYRSAWWRLDQSQVGSGRSARGHSSGKSATRRQCRRPLRSISEDRSNNNISLKEQKSGVFIFHAFMRKKKYAYYVKTHS